MTEQGGDLALTRLAVGEHILLGGDNMDLALAYAVAATLPGGMEGLDPVQRVGLTYACRNAKEALFSDPKKGSAPVARARPRLEGDRRLGEDGADPRDARPRARSTASSRPASRPNGPTGAGGSA